MECTNKEMGCSEEPLSHHWSCLLVHFEKHAWHVLIIIVRYIRHADKEMPCHEVMKSSTSLEAGDATGHLKSTRADEEEVHVRAVIGVFMRKNGGNLCKSWRQVI